MTAFTVNNTSATVDVDTNKPLLWVLREDLEVLGPKYGCGIAQCGACRVLIDGVSTPSCIVPVGTIEGASIVTVEGLADAQGNLSVVQRAWIEEPGRDPCR